MFLRDVEIVRGDEVLQGFQDDTRELGERVALPSLDRRVGNQLGDIVCCKTTGHFRIIGAGRSEREKARKTEPSNITGL